MHTQIEITQQPLNSELKKQIETGFSRHCISAIGHDERGEPLAFIAHVDHQFAGAIVVQLFWGALHIKYVYVEELYRGKTLGSQLMCAALCYGRSNHCSFAFVETMSFQALEFYKKQGFQLDFTRSGYKHHTAFHYLSRNLDPDLSQASQ